MKKELDVLLPILTALLLAAFSCFLGCTFPQLIYFFCPNYFNAHTRWSGLLEPPHAVQTGFIAFTDAVDARCQEFQSMRCANTAMFISVTLFGYHGYCTMSYIIR